MVRFLKLSKSEIESNIQNICKRKKWKIMEREDTKNMIFWHLQFIKLMYSPILSTEILHTQKSCFYFENIYFIKVCIMVSPMDHPHTITHFIKSSPIIKNFIFKIAKCHPELKNSNLKVVPWNLFNT